MHVWLGGSEYRNIKIHLASILDIVTDVGHYSGGGN